MKYIKFIEKNKIILLIFVIATLLLLIIKNISFLLLKIKVKLPKIDSYIIIKYGNILKSKNNICLASSNLFNVDTNIINKNSVLGKLVNGEYKNNIANIDEELKQSLNHYEHKLVNVRHGGHNFSYPVGSIGCFERRDKKVYLIAITNIDDSQSELIPESKKEYIDLALNNLWIKLRNESDNNDLSIPIIGTGISKSKNSKYFSILDICDSFINESTNKKIINNLEIIVYKDDLSIDSFNLLKKTLKELVK
jgi:hypothetical protein